MFRETIDELREDFSWVTRNGLPVQPIEHFIVKRMARDPVPAIEREAQLERTEIPGRPSVLILIDVSTGIGESRRRRSKRVAQGQQSLWLNALDALCETKSRPPSTIQADEPK